MIPIPTSISTKIAGFTVLGLAVAIGIAALWCNARIDVLRADVAEAQRALVIEEGNTERLRRELRAQTAQVQAWKEEAARQQDAAQRAQAAAKVARAALDRRADNLYAIKLPTEECDALRLVVDTDRAGRMRVAP